MIPRHLAAATLVASALVPAPARALEAPRPPGDPAVRDSSLVLDAMRQSPRRPDLTGRAPLFIWNNPGVPQKAGTNAGFQVWIGDNPTPTPGPSDTVGGTIAVVNGNNRGALWGMNIFTQSCKACGPGFVDAKTTGLEIEAGYRIQANKMHRYAISN